MEPPPRSNEDQQAFKEQKLALGNHPEWFASAATYEKGEYYDSGDREKNKHQ